MSKVKRSLCTLRSHSLWHHYSKYTISINPRCPGAPYLLGESKSFGDLRTEKPSPHRCFLPPGDVVPNRPVLDQMIGVVGPGPVAGLPNAPCQPRVGEVAALQLPDVHMGQRSGLLIIRRGKGLKHREVPLVREAREPLQVYLTHRRKLAEKWAQKAAARLQCPPKWAAWPDGHLFLGRRGPLTERGLEVPSSLIPILARIPAVPRQG